MRHFASHSESVCYSNTILICFPHSHTIHLAISLRSGSFVLSSNAIANRAKCFGTEYFSSCLEVLLLKEESDKYTIWRERLGKK